MTTFIVIFIVFLCIISFIQVLDLDIDVLPECVVIRYSNPFTRIRNERIFPRKTGGQA